MSFNKEVREAILKGDWVLAGGNKAAKARLFATLYGNNSYTGDHTRQEDKMSDSSLATRLESPNVDNAQNNLVGRAAEPWFSIAGPNRSLLRAVVNEDTTVGYNLYTKEDRDKTGWYTFQYEKDLEKPNKNGLIFCTQIEPRETMQVTDDDVLRMGGPLYCLRVRRMSFGFAAYEISHSEALQIRHSAWREGMFLVYKEHNSRMTLMLKTRDGRTGPWIPTAYELLEDLWEVWWPTQKVLEDQIAGGQLTVEDVKNEMQPKHLKQPRRLVNNEPVTFPWEN